ncbi:MAG TPA: DMT family transporter [Microvirga sp.]|jgi:drug/metabolite transporter (DMT)-like permease|nr:DMT family transporter [Microvirga sp.]
MSRKVTILLLLNGLVLATHTLLARQASLSGVAPLVYALVSAAGAAVFLGLYRAARPAGAGGITRTIALYGLVAGFVSIALPQALIYSASAYVSAGIASLAYAFPTPLTYVLAALFGIERASKGRTLGVGIAFAGAVGLAVSRSAAVSGDALWIGLAMLAPVAIAFGNIYRQRFWPPGSQPLDLAFAMSSAASLWLGLALLATVAAGTPPPAILPAGYGYLAAAAAVAAVGNVIYFELQRSGGIVSFSQIGYVGAVLGLLGGAVLLGERYAASTWIAALVIAAGVAVSEILKRRGAAARP